MNVEHVVECNRQPDPMASDPAKSDELILVDVFDNPVGAASKERAHRESLLHRAFSVVLVRDGASGPEVLVTRRALCKYHSAGLWTNSCCSHPRVGESTVDAAYRRVAQELGVQARDLREIGSFSIMFLRWFWLCACLLMVFPTSFVGFSSIILKIKKKDNIQPGFWAA
jgi:isopentenyl-diphosphate delta-isomerase